jgi:CubicO group peptidase (beta-lactamase class C family)
MKKYLILSLCLVLAGGLIGLNASEKNPKLEERIARVENGLLKAVLIKGQPAAPMKISDRMAHFKVPGVSIAVINDFEIEWAKGYGVKEAGKDSLVTPETLFQAASISKPVAALAALRLVQAGALGLDDEANANLVSWKIPENGFTGKKKVTLRGLLSHTAGLTVHGFRGYAQGEPIPTLRQVLDGEKPANSAPIRVDILPGSQWRYSGGGYVVMQQLLIDLKRKPFPKIMDELVLKPVGMNQSTYEQPLPDSRRGAEATAHKSNGQPIQGKWHTYPEMAAAGLWTTPSDLCRYAIEIARAWSGKSDKILSLEIAKEMLTRELDDYGLGLQLGGSGEKLSFGHGGGNEGFRCYLVAFPVTGMGAAVMTNGDNGSSLYSEVLRSVAREYGWTDFLPKEKEIRAVDPKVFESYVGKYQLMADFFLIVTEEDGKLFAAPVGEPKSEFFSESEVKFFDLERDAELTFLKDTNGQYSELLLSYGGAQLKGKKVK